MPYLCIDLYDPEPKVWNAWTTSYFIYYCCNYIIFPYLPVAIDRIAPKDSFQNNESQILNYGSGCLYGDVVATMVPNFKQNSQRSTHHSRKPFTSVAIC